jgi:trans-2,3-dihydro-3-hydroxyanthranilate isomerase
MPEYQYYLLDVFTEQRLAGNQLSVLPEADGLDDRRMQMIAREFNLSETVFLFPPTRAEALFTVRIFTPGSEIGFAGHPTIGTAVLLASLGRMPTEAGRGRAVLDLAAGPVPVSIENDIARLRAPKAPIILGSFRADNLASAVGLSSDQVVGQLRIASAGTPFAFLQANSVQSVDDLVPDFAAIVRAMPSPATGLTVFAKGGPGEYGVRMFAPQDGIFEDPATGSSAAAMAALLLEDEPDWEGRAVLIRQGVRMGRPSEIFLTAGRHEDGTPYADVAGKAVLIGEGRLFL